MQEIKKFNALNVSSKFAICGLPIRVDTYKTCAFGCEYCFANCRKIMEFKKELQIGNMKQVEKKLDKIFNKREVDPNSFLDTLISQRITWHCGGMSDPFQPIEKELGVTKELVEISKRYNIHILFSTKSDSIYEADIIPELHTFQFSVTNINNLKNIEPNVPSIENRYKLYRELKDKGFKVGIRIQPFIPNVSTLEIVKMFKDADNFTLEGIKIVPQNKDHKEYILQELNLDKKEFTQKGLLNLKPNIRLKMYEPFIEFFKENNIPYSMADNDLHYLSTNKCCCGDRLVNKSTDFNNTAMIYKYGENYTKEQMYKELLKCGVSDCKCNYLFTSNRQEGCVSVQEFYEKRFERSTSPFSPKFQYKENQLEFNSKKYTKLE